MNEYDDGMVAVHIGHVLEVLPQLPAGSVHTVVSSPPYWRLRRYDVPDVAWGGDPGHAHEWGPEHRYVKGGVGQNKGLDNSAAYRQARDTEAQVLRQGRFCECGAWLGQLGLEPTLGQYLAHVVEVFEQVRRVLRDDGTLWLNMGDCYETNPKGPNGDDKSTLTPSGVRVQRAEHRAGKGGAGLKQKDLVGQPWRVAFALQDAGWWLRKDIVWSKPNPMPESVNDRPATSHEYLFLFAKSRRYFYDAEAVKEPVSGTAHARGREGADERGVPAGWSHLREPGGPATLELGEQTAANNPVGLNPKARSAAPGSRQNESFTLAITPQPYTSGNKARKPRPVPAEKGSGVAGSVPWTWDGESGRNLRSVWTIATQPYAEAHFATFPEELPRRCILAGTSAKGCCSGCGAPWRRLVQAARTYGAWHDHENRLEKGNRQEHGLKSGRFYAQYEPPATVGWVPGCGCGTGLAADAFELIGSPLAESGEDGYQDPTLEVGRAGFSRPRKDGEGLSWMTRHEQRQYAAQLRRMMPERFAQAEAEAGEAALGHYGRTDYPNGARAIPADLLERWLERGWLSRAESPYDRVAGAPAPVPCTVLDPFAGSGTTLAVAKGLDRRAVGVDVGYLGLIARRVGGVAPQLSMSEVL